MRFTLTELERRKIVFETVYAPGEIDFGGNFRQQGGLVTAGTAEVLANTNGEIRVRGHVQVILEGDCDRCLEPAALPVAGDFDCFYGPAPRGGTHEEHRLADGEVDIAFYEGDGVELQDVLREYVLLALPLHVLCRPDCKGLCPVCGVDRNQTACSCAAAPGDSRWSALPKL
jgi:uncharacterized protein